MVKARSKTSNEHFKKNDKNVLCNQCCIIQWQNHGIVCGHSTATYTRNTTAKCDWWLLKLGSLSASSDISKWMIRNGHTFEYTLIEICIWCVRFESFDLAGCQWNYTVSDITVSTIVSANDARKHCYCNCNTLCIQRSQLPITFTASPLPPPMPSRRHLHTTSVCDVFSCCGFPIYIKVYCYMCVSSVSTYMRCVSESILNNNLDWDRPWAHGQRILTQTNAFRKN